MNKIKNNLKLILSDKYTNILVAILTVYIFYNIIVWYVPKADRHLTYNQVILSLSFTHYTMDMVAMLLTMMSHYLMDILTLYLKDILTIAMLEQILMVYVTYKMVDMTMVSLM